MKFRPGDKVAPSPQAFKDFPNNDFGSGIGVVLSDSGFGIYDYEVVWVGGSDYYYYDSHLLPVITNLENE